MPLALTFILCFPMCLLSFVYHLIDGSIDQYITNDTAGVNDKPGLGRISPPRKIDQLAASLCRSTLVLTHTHARGKSPPHQQLYHNTLSSLPAHALRSLEKICPNAKMRGCANAEMSENLNEHGGYNRDQGSPEEPQQQQQHGPILAPPDRSE